MLDGVRGLAILMVMARHFGQTMEPKNAIDSVFFKITQLGSNGVDLFFVLSGFLITGILLDTRESPSYFRRFYWRRTLRIFPLYYVSLAICFFIWPLLTGLHPSIAFAFEKGVGTAPHYQIFYWAYLQNFLFAYLADYPGLAHFWSLATEEQFYLFWPLVVYLLPSRHVWRACVALVGISLASRLICAGLQTSVITPYTLLFCRLDGLAIGGLLATLARRDAGLEPLRKIAWVVGPIVAAIIVVVFGIQSMRGNAAVRTHTINILIGMLMPVLFGTLLLLVVAAPVKSLLHRAFASHLLVFFGKYSYCIYVSHILLQEFVFYFVKDEMFPKIAGSIVPGRIVIMLLCTLLSVAVALVSWNVLEKPLLKLKDRVK
ncbi:MAG: acyltransferase [Tepidisphaeraceae bacterium]